MLQLNPSLNDLEDNHYYEFGLEVKCVTTKCTYLEIHLDRKTFSPKICYDSSRGMKLHTWQKQLNHDNNY